MNADETSRSSSIPTPGMPSGLFRRDSVTPEWRAQFKAAMDYSWRRFQIMVGDDYGIRWQPTFEETGKPLIQGDWLDPYYPNARMLSAGEHPFPIDNVVAFDTMYVETPRYLARMMRDFQQRGGRVEQRSFADVADIAALPERLVFNCTGIGARQLFGDTGLQPVRGQLAVLQPQPEVRYAASGDWGYMFARPDGILLGGTFERDVWEPTPDPAAIARIVGRHQRFFTPSFTCFTTSKCMRDLPKSNGWSPKAGITSSIQRA